MLERWPSVAAVMVRKRVGARRRTFTGWECTCSRCEYEWVSLGRKPSKRCPRCKSPYWDRPRVRLQKAPAGGSQGR
jgi:predicted Zn-ribbon and HTH transcriptional regulator